MGQSFIDRNRLWARLNGAVAAHGTPLPAPTMVVDLDAFDANADDLVRRAGGKPVRVASKSLRVPALLERALDHDGFHGVLAYTLREVGEKYNLSRERIRQIQAVALAKLRVLLGRGSERDEGLAA